MDIQNSVPSLSNLTDIDIRWSSQCHWRNKPKKKKTVQKCGNLISAVDIKRREIHIHNLHNLISASSTDTSNPSSTAGLDSSPKIQKILKELSELFVCKRHHRDKSAAVFSKWSIELEELQKSVSQLVKYDVWKIFNIEDEKILSCQGETSSEIGCKNRISARNCASANTRIEHIANTRDGSPITREDLEVVAGLLMCRRYHQGQAVGKAEEWFKKLQELYPLANNSSAEQSIQEHPSREQQTPIMPQPSTPVSRRTPTRDSETPESRVSSVWSRASSVAASTPATSSPNQRRYDHTDTPPDSTPPARRTIKINNDAVIAPSLVVSKKVTRSRVHQEGSGSLRPELITPSFKPFPREEEDTFLGKLCTKIKGNILPQEKSSGNVYVFRRKGEKLCKIGYTHKEVKVRIHEWEMSCNQTVEILVEEQLPHAAKIERLVHLTLQRERRREIVCNSSKGCLKTHIEWFEDAPEHIKNVIGLWKRWITTEPYDKSGSLKAIWVKHIDQLRTTKMMHSLEPWRGWIDTTILAAGTTVEMKPEPVLIGDNNDSTTVKAETMVLVTNAEVKGEIKLEAKADIQNLQQKLSSLSRIFVEKIHELRETSKENPHSDSPTVQPRLPLRSDDLFISPVVTPVGA